MDQKQKRSRIRYAAGQETEVRNNRFALTGAGPPAAPYIVPN